MDGRLASLAEWLNLSHDGPILTLARVRGQYKQSWRPAQYEESPFGLTLGRHGEGLPAGTARLGSSLEAIVASRLPYGATHPARLTTRRTLKSVAIL